jgi:hypothetical protein
MGGQYPQFAAQYCAILEPVVLAFPGLWSGNDMNHRTIARERRRAIVRGHLKKRATWQFTVDLGL